MVSFGIIIFLSLVYWGLSINLAVGSKNYIVNLSAIKGRKLQIIGGISRGLLILLIFDEVGLLLNEWGWEFFPFEVTRMIISIPGISHLVYLANLFVAIYAAYEMSITRFESDMDEEEVISKSNMYASSILCMSLLLISMQFLSYGYGVDMSIPGGNSVITLALFVIPSIINVVVLAKRNISKFTKSEADMALIIMFFSLTQTMITKVIVIIDVIKYGRRKILHKEPVATDYLLLRSSLRSKFIGARMNGLLLGIYFLPMVLLWTAQASPLPSTSTYYPKGITVSFFFMGAIFSFYLIEAMARKWISQIRLLFMPVMLVMTFLPLYISDHQWVISSYGSISEDSSMLELFYYNTQGGMTSAVIVILIVIMASYVEFLAFFITEDLEKISLKVRKLFIYGIHYLKQVTKALILSSLVYIIVSSMPYFFSVDGGTWSAILIAFVTAVTINTIFYGSDVISVGSPIRAYYSEDFHSRVVKFKANKIKLVLSQCLIVTILLGPSIYEHMYVDAYAYRDVSVEKELFADGNYLMQFAPVYVDRIMIVGGNGDGLSRIIGYDSESGDLIGEMDFDRRIRSLDKVGSNIVVSFADSEIFIINQAFERLYVDRKISDVNELGYVYAEGESYTFKDGKGEIVVPDSENHSLVPSNQELLVIVDGELKHYKNGKWFNIFGEIGEHDKVYSRGSYLVHMKQGGIDLHDLADEDAVKSLVFDSLSNQFNYELVTSDVLLAYVQYGEEVDSYYINLNSGSIKALGRVNLLNLYGRAITLKNVTLWDGSFAFHNGSGNIPVSPVYDLETGERVDYVNTYDRITFDHNSMEVVYKDEDIYVLSSPLIVSVFRTSTEELIKRYPIEYKRPTEDSVANNICLYRKAYIAGKVVWFDVS